MKHILFFFFSLTTALDRPWAYLVGPAMGHCVEDPIGHYSEHSVGHHFEDSMGHRLKRPWKKPCGTTPGIYE